MRGFPENLRFAAGLKQSGLLFYNNVLALPMMASYMFLCTDELRLALSMEQMKNPQFLVRFIFTGGHVLSLIYRAPCESLQKNIACESPSSAYAGPPL